MRRLRERARAATCNGWLEGFFRAAWNDEVRIESLAAEAEEIAPALEPAAPAALV
jgi:hypothetical protein